MKSHNFHDIWTVAKFTMRDMVSRKSFRISTIIILILIVLGFNVPNILNSSTDGDVFETKTLFVDRDHLLGDISADSEQASQEENSPVIWGQFSDDEIKEKLQNDSIDAAWVITKGDRENGFKLQYLVKNRATSPEPANETIMLIQQIYAINQLQKHGYSEKDIQGFYPTISVGVEQIEDQEIGGNIGAMLILSALLFFAIYFCAFQVSSSITIEKTSKIIETLVTSTSPRSIILGKTIGIGLVGLGQVLLFVLTAIFSAQAFLAPGTLEQIFDLSNFTPYLAIISLLYFILGYFSYALLYALTGSTVAKPEDIQAANTPVVIVTMVGFYLAYFTLLNPTSELNVIASLLPISSPFCMPLRIMMGIASVWDVALSLTLLVIFCIIVAYFAIKIYSNAILNYGSRLTLSEIFKNYREEGEEK